MFYQTSKSKSVKIGKLDSNKLSESIKHRDSPVGTLSNQQNGQGLQEVNESEIEKFNQLDWGYFKYNKSRNQLNKLKQLKNQYEKIRDMKVQEQRILSKQYFRQGESSKQGSDKSNASEKEPQKNKIRQSQWGQYQKRQLESMITNSIGKIEQLLRNEMEYKKKILDLESEIRLRTPIIEKEYKEEIQKQKQKQVPWEQNERIAYLTKIQKLQQEKQQKTEDISRLKQENKKLQDCSYVAKNEIINLKMDINRTQLEKQTIQKSKDLQIKKLQKNISILETELKNLRTKLENQLMSNNQLRQSIQKTKQNENAQGSRQRSIQARLSQLESLVEAEKQEKKEFLSQVEDTIREFNNLKQQNEQLKNENKNLKKISKQLQDQFQSFSRLKITHENQEIRKSKIYESQKKQLVSASQILQKQLSLTQSKFEEKVLVYEQRLEQTQIELDKMKKHHLLTIQIQQSKHRAQLQIARSQLAVILREKHAQRIKYEKIREQIKMQQTLRQEEKHFLAQQYNRSLEVKDKQIEALRSLIEETKRNVRQQYQQQLFTLMSRLDEVVMSNEKCSMQIGRLAKVESEYHEIRERMKRMMGITSQIEHLWQVKQSQYCNMKDLLSEIQV